MTLAVLTAKDLQIMQEIQTELSEHFDMPVDLQMEEFDDSEFSFDSTRYHLRITNLLVTTDKSAGEEIFGNVSMGPGTSHMSLPCVWQNFRKQLSDCDTLSVFNMDTGQSENYHPLPADLDLEHSEMELPPEEGGLPFEPPRGWNPDNDQGPSWG